MMHEKPYKDMKGEDKEYAARDAANCLKQHTAIMKDKPLLAAAREVLKREIADAQTALKK